jgi:PKD repeat protein
MSIDWGDGTPATNFDYPLSPCQGQEGADANHRYAAPGTYTVQLIVTSMGCDGTGTQRASAQVRMAYPSSPPA